MEVRAKKKNCESINHKQNCTTPEKIKYHCVINELENAFIEVCAPEYRIHGMLSLFNKGSFSHINTILELISSKSFVVLLTY